jgi:hypothetical protein
MSTARNAAIDRAVDTIRHFDNTQDPIRSVAIAVINTLNPQITDAKQMIGVPEGSILIVPVHSGVTPATWRAGRLWEDLERAKSSHAPEWVLERYGPLTVVWMP